MMAVFFNSGAVLFSFKFYFNYSTLVTISFRALMKDAPALRDPMRRKESPFPRACCPVSDIDVVEGLDVVGGEHDRDLDEALETRCGSGVDPFLDGRGYPGLRGVCRDALPAERLVSDAGPGGDHFDRLLDLPPVRFAGYFIGRLCAEKR